MSFIAKYTSLSYSQSFVSTALYHECCFSSDFKLVHLLLEAFKSTFESLLGRQEASSQLSPLPLAY